MIPYGHQHVDDDDIAAVVAVLKGDWLTRGPAVDRFEERVREVTGARHAVAFANGTAALHGATYAAGLGAGHTVATSPLSFAASANCVRYVGATVRFLDIDPATLNVDPTGCPPGSTAWWPSTTPAWPWTWRPARRADRPRVVIEDAAHALGATTPSGPVGNCAHSDLCCFSFHPVKVVTTGEGGAVTTNSDELADRLRTFRHHGIRPDPDGGAWAYDIPELGIQLPAHRHPGRPGRQPAGNSTGSCATQRPPIATALWPGGPSLPPEAAGIDPRLSPVRRPGGRPGPGIRRDATDGHRCPGPLRAHLPPPALPRGPDSSRPIFRRRRRRTSTSCRFRSSPL